ncbi:MAG: DALR domain-containing protein, partial [Albidovulum sp.]
DEDRDSVVSAFTGRNPPRTLVEALSDDLNTALVVSHLHALSKMAKTNLQAKIELAEALEFLGFDYKSNWSVSFGYSLDKILDEGSVEKLILALITEREAARKAKNFTRADEIRDAFEAAGVIVVDTGTGPEWDRASIVDLKKLEAVK